MTAVVVPDEEEAICNACHLAPRLPGKRMTWCRECKNAWQRAYRAGVRKQERVPAPVRTPSGCLLWQGYVTPEGYGRLNRGQVYLYAHRVAWEAVYGAIPDGLTVDHDCEVKTCVEVSHLQLVTRGRNTELYYERRREEVFA